MAAAADTIVHGDRCCDHGFLFSDYDFCLALEGRKFELCEQGMS